MQHRLGGQPRCPAAHFTLSSAARAARRRSSDTSVHCRLKAIEDIEVGDKVLSWDPTSGRQRAQPVDRLYRHKDKPILEVCCVDQKGLRQTIHATTEHPFWVQSQGWTAASRLQPGDQLRSADIGLSVWVEAVRDSGRSQDVYNFEVRGLHNFFVGSLGLLVHNSSGDPAQGAQPTLRRYLVVDSDGTMKGMRDRSVYGRLEHINNEWGTTTPVTPKPGQTFFSPSAVSFLHQILQEDPHAQIVLGSTWARSMSRDRFVSLLEEHGTPLMASRVAKGDAWALLEGDVQEARMDALKLHANRFSDGRLDHYVAFDDRLSGWTYIGSDFDKAGQVVWADVWKGLGDPKQRESQLQAYRAFQQRSDAVAQPARVVKESGVFPAAVSTGIAGHANTFAYDAMPMDGSVHAGNFGAMGAEFGPRIGRARQLVEDGFTPTIMFASNGFGVPMSGFVPGLSPTVTGGKRRDIPWLGYIDFDDTLTRLGGKQDRNRITPEAAELLRRTHAMAPNGMKWVVSSSRVWDTPKEWFVDTFNAHGLRDISQNLMSRWRVDNIMYGHAKREIEITTHAKTHASWIPLEYQIFFDDHRSWAVSADSPLNQRVVLAPRAVGLQIAQEGEVRRIYGR